ncbi:hypothetical protein RND71_025439 [Anisodus tanguticus]|uniref:Uncharacterized protein n=1 Tax=Anisodus tanguticus TaxID=243964 RepID=A0AAE1V4U8_9SOLA|nr:hypothetical protein RND71_025439 [Anisodus tanguticus]
MLELEEKGTLMLPLRGSNLPRVVLGAVEAAPPYKAPGRRGLRPRIFIFRLLISDVIEKGKEKKAWPASTGLKTRASTKIGVGDKCINGIGDKCFNKNLVLVTKCINGVGDMCFKKFGVGDKCINRVGDKKIWCW